MARNGLTDAQEKEILQEARDRLKLAIDAEAKNREAAKDDLEFLSGDQWSDYAIKARENRVRLTINRLPAYVRQVVNEQRKTRPAIDIIPADAQASKPTADVIQGMVRHIERTSRAKVAYDNAFMYAVSCGFGHFRIKTDYIDDQSFDQEIMVERIPNPFSVYRDPASLQPDHADDEFAFVTDFVEPEEFEEQYGFRPAEISDVGKADDIAPWFDGKRVRVAEYWRVVTDESELTALSDGAVLTDRLSSEQRKGLEDSGVTVKNTRTTHNRRVECYIVTGTRVIKKQEWQGKYIPIITCIGEEMNINGETKLASLIRYAKDPARMYNYMASAETEQLALQSKAPFIAARGQIAPDLAGTWARANRDNVPYLEYDPMPGEPPPQRQMPPQLPAGTREARMAAAEDVKAVLGMYDASMGARSNETSGVAIKARQLEGDVSTFHFIDNFGTAVEHAGRVIIDLIPKIYDMPRMVRIVTPTNEAQMAVINQLFVDPATGQEMIHRMDLGRYDVAVRVGPSFESKRQEMVESMVELSAANPSLMQLAGDLVVRNMDWPQSEEIADRIQQAQQAQAGKPDPAQALAEAQVKTEQIKGEAAVQKSNVELQIKQMELQIKGQEAQIKGQEVEIARIEQQLRAAGTGAEATLDAQKIAVEREKVAVERMKVENERMQMHLTAQQAMMAPAEPQMDEQGNPKPQPEPRPAPMPMQMGGGMDMERHMQMMNDLIVSIGHLVGVMAAPRVTTLRTGPNGKPIGSISEPVVSSPSAPTVQ